MCTFFSIANDKPLLAAIIPNNFPSSCASCATAGNWCVKLAPGYTCKSDGSLAGSYMGRSLSCPAGCTCSSFTSPNDGTSCPNYSIRIDQCGGTPTPTVTIPIITTPVVTTPIVTTPPPAWCTPCNPYNTCPGFVPPSKWRQTPVTYYGSYQSCPNTGDQCPPGQSSCSCPSYGGSCQNTHYQNTRPSCSVTIDRNYVQRSDAPMNVRLTVNDNDYGDTVEITGYRVSNYCATVRTPGGAEPFGTVVKIGSDDPNRITSQITDFVVNPQVAHGIYTNENGRSLCRATLTFEIRDRLGDGLDTQDTAQCSVDFTVENQAPQLQSVQLLDRDPVTSLRKPGNLVNGTPTVWVSSQNIANRPQRCTTAVDLNGNPPTNCTTQTPIATKTNPFEFSFTVSDANGANDIGHAGIWLQRSDTPNGSVTPQLPPIFSSARRSIASLYNDFSDRTLNSGTTHWVSRYDFNANLSSSSKLSGYRFNLMAAGSSQSRYRTSGYREWAALGFPDCYNTSAGCGINNIPSESRNQFTVDSNSSRNYLWDAVANGNSYVCYDNTLAARVTSQCDSTCAACIRRSQTISIQQSGNTLKFSFELQINESLGEGKYSVFLVADDKVGASLNNGTPWGSFTRSGAYCAGSNCPNQFQLGVDKTAPTFQTNLSSLQGDEIRATVSGITDNLSGYAGVYRIIYYKVNPVSGPAFLNTTFPSGQINCTYNGAGGNGKCNVNTPATGFSFDGHGVSGNDTVHSYVCAYDVAGNGTCRLDPMNPAFKAADKWLKTSLGSVYTNTSRGSANAFQVQLPSFPVNLDNSVANDIIYSPFSSVSQQNSIVSHFFGTGSNVSGVSGGNNGNNGGVSPTYRRLDDAGNIFNKFGIVDDSGSRVGSGGWYNRMLSLANFNCPILRASAGATTLPSGYNSKCQPLAGSDAATLNFISNGTVENKMITLNIPSGSTLNIDTNLVCRNTNLIFVASGTLSINRQLQKSGAGLQSDSCLFIIASGATLQIGDTVDNRFTAGGGNTPGVDRFQASVVADGDFITPTGVRNTNSVYDELQINGFVYMSRSVPQFKRDLVFSQNKQFPSEWLIYDAQVNDAFRNILGIYKYSEIKCGASSHPVCGD